MSLKPGLQVAHGYFIGAQLLADLKGFGYEVMRIEQGETPEITRALAQEVLDAGLTPLVILFQAEHAAALPSGAWAEVENEPDMGYPDRATAPRGPMTPSEVIALAQAVDARLPAGIPVFACGVMNLTRRSLGYLARVEVGLPSRFGISAHRYPGDSWEQPKDGFRSRDEEVRELFRIAGRRDVAITECGYHTAPRVRGFKGFLYRLLGRQTRWTDADVQALWAREWAFWRDVDAVHGGRLRALVKYNVNDGPDRDNPLHAYGIRTYPGPDGCTWKVSAPVA